MVTPNGCRSMERSLAALGRRGRRRTEGRLTRVGGERKNDWSHGATEFPSRSRKAGPCPHPPFQGRKKIGGPHP